MTHKELFEILATKNVNEYTEERDGLTYLSWSWAWKEFLKVVPDATYQVRMFPQPDGTLLPYCGNGKMGYMVFTSVTANGITRECYLPVMDGKNKTMKDEPYKYSTKSGEKTVEAVSMFDVNKAIMRCLAKNLAMFGLGIYIYSGEDIPEDFTTATTEQIEKIKSLYSNIASVLKWGGVGSLEELTRTQANQLISQKENG